jgi:WD40 repeat protein
VNIVVLPNKYLASGSFDNTIKIWDPYKRILVKTLEGHESAVFSLSITKDGLLASTGDSTSIKLWDTNNGFKLKHFYSNKIIDFSIVAANGYFVGIFSYFRKMFIWDLEKSNFRETKPFIMDLGKFCIYFLLKLKKSKPYYRKYS